MLMGRNLQSEMCTRIHDKKSFFSLKMVFIYLFTIRLNIYVVTNTLRSTAIIFTLNGTIGYVIKFLRFLIILGMFDMHCRGIGNSIENAQSTISEPR